MVKNIVIGLLVAFLVGSLVALAGTSWAIVQKNGEMETKLSTAQEESERYRNQFWDEVHYSRQRNAVNWTFVQSILDTMEVDHSVNVMVTEGQVRTITANRHEQTVQVAIECSREAPCYLNRESNRPDGYFITYNAR